MKKNQCLSCLVIALFMIGSVLTFTPRVAAAPQFTDLDNHWAAGQIRSMVDQGIATGYPDNTFKPDNQVTRAEFVTLVNKAFQFTGSAEINYPDVGTGDWFAPEISKAKAAGYVGGYDDGTIRPLNDISRQEAAAIIVKAARLESGQEQELAKFQDAADIPAWSKGALAALVSQGYMGGYPDGTIKAVQTISRAEAVVILAKAITSATVSPPQPAALTADLSKLDKAGTYGPATGNQAVSGNVTINVSGVTLQNATIGGDLLITEAVGSGDVTLRNVTVKGTTNIKGGGTNTVKIDNCILGKLVVNKSDGNIRLLLSGTTSISELVADSAVEVKGQATITKAVINKANVVVEAKPGTTTISSGISAIIAGKTETGARSSSGSSGGGNSDSAHKVLIVKAGCTLTYVEIFGQTRARVETIDDATVVTANGNNMHNVDGKWQFDLDGNVSTVTVVATDGINNETYILNK